jgi:hypothetical protein
VVGVSVGGAVTYTVGITCGMNNERDLLNRVFGAYPQVRVYSGDDRLNFPSLVPASVRLMLDMGLCGGIGPGVHVADAVIATTLSHRTGAVRKLTGSLQDRLRNAAIANQIAIKSVPYFSSGLFGTSDTLEQRQAIYNLEPDKPVAMSDETRFTDALTDSRGIEMQVCRVLSDSIYEDANLPPAARGHILRSNGAVDIPFLVGSLLLSPLQIPALMKLKSDLDKAMVVLEQYALAIRSVILAY